MENAEAKPRVPIVNIVIENFDPGQADDYGCRLMMPLIRAALKHLEANNSADRAE